MRHPFDPRKAFAIVFVAEDNFLDVGHDAFRAIHGGGIGQLHVEDQIALVLLGNESRGGVDELPASQHQKTAVKYQNDQTHSQHMARPRCRRRGDAVEAAVEAAEKPTQHRVHRADEEPAQHQADRQGPA